MLTSLDKAKTWLGVTTSTDDAMLTRLIGQVSQWILSYLNRPYILKRQYTETFMGSGRARTLKNYPVLSVSSVSVSGGAIPANINAGYWFETDDLPPGRPTTIRLNGYGFSGPCTITYTAGYFLEEAHTSGPSVTVDAPYGSWAEDGGVTADGTPLTKVASSPSAGEYSVSNGVYEFGDSGTDVMISYSYVPAALEEACLELVGERYRYKDRIGHASKSIGGQETISYNLKNMPDYVHDALQPFKRVVPI
ncbi:MAG: phage head-tail connector protein [Blastocatellales bacterium]